jgi:hypothetical protein
MSSNLFAKTKSPDTVIVARVWNSDNIKISLIRGASLFAWQWEITGLYFNCITKYFFWVWIYLFGHWILKGFILWNRYICFLWTISFLIRIFCTYGNYIYLLKLSVCLIISSIQDVDKGQFILEGLAGWYILSFLWSRGYYLSFIY